MAIKATYTHPAAPNNAERSTEWYFPHEIKTAMAIPALSRSVATDFNHRHQKGYSGMWAVLGFLGVFFLFKHFGLVGFVFKQFGLLLWVPLADFVDIESG